MDDMRRRSRVDALLASAAPVLLVWLAACVADCAGTPGGSAILDACGTCVGGAAGGSPCAVWHVAADGSGTACTAAAPCALATAQALVRARAPTMSEDFDIQLRGGTYALDAPLQLGPEDSGHNGFRVRYLAQAGELPVLDGGRRVTGFTLYDGARDLYRAAFSGQTRHLFVDGQRATRARGRIAGTTRKTYDAGGAPTGYTTTDVSLLDLLRPADLEVFSTVAWKSFRCGVQTLAAGGDGVVLTLDSPCWEYAHRHGGPFAIDVPDYLENALELLDTPGEWYHDAAAGYLYYRPRPGEDPSSAEVVAPLLEQLLVADGAHDVTLQGLAFRHATWLEPSTAAGYPPLQAGVLIRGAVQPGTAYWYGDAPRSTPGAVVLRDSDRLHLRDCSVAHLGAAALEVRAGSDDNVIEGNRFVDLSSSALRLGDVYPETAAAVAGNVFANNFVSEASVELVDAPAIFVGYASGSRILHNELRATPYSGISLGWGWSDAATFAGDNEVTGNVIGPVLTRLADGGGVYTLSTQPGSRVSGNVIAGASGRYAIGLYFDQGSEHFEVDGNLVAGASDWLMLQATYAPLAQGNDVHDNFTDTAGWYCCSADFGCCTDRNTIAGNTIVAPGAWPRQARELAAQAGLEPGFIHLRDPRTSVEAEDYRHGGSGVGFYDRSPGDSGGASQRETRLPDGPSYSVSFAPDDVDLYPCLTCSGERVVGDTEDGEWLAYTLDVRAPGTYRFDFVVATPASGQHIAVATGALAWGEAALPSTGGFSTYGEASLEGVRLPRGLHELRLTLSGGFAFDRFAYTRTAPGCGGSPPSRTLTGDFDGDGATEALALHTSPLCWEAAGEVWLTGWGTGAAEVVGDFDGDGKDDVLVIFQDGGGTWRWHLAESFGVGFVAYPDAQVGYGHGSAACARNLDADAADEVVIEWTPSVCAALDVTTHQFVPASCAETCP